MNTLLEILPISVEQQFNKDLPVVDLQNIIFDFLDCEIYGNQIIHNVTRCYDECNKRILEHFRTMEKSKCAHCKRKTKKLYFTTDVDDCILGSNSGGMKLYLLCKKCSVEYTMSYFYEVDWKEEKEFPKPRKTELGKIIGKLEKGKYTEIIGSGVWCIWYDDENIRDFFEAQERTEFIFKKRKRILVYESSDDESSD